MLTSTILFCSCLVLVGTSSFVASQQRSDWRERNVELERSRTLTGSNRSFGGISPRKFKVGGLSPRKFKVGGISPRCSVSRGIVPRETNFGKSRGGLSRTFPVADSRGLFTLFSAAEVPPIRGGSDRIRGGTNLFRGSPPSPRRIPRRTFLFREESEFGGLRRVLRLDRTYADVGGPRRSPPRKKSAT